MTQKSLRPVFNVSGRWGFGRRTSSAPRTSAKTPLLLEGVNVVNPLAIQIQHVLPRTQDNYYKLILAVGPERTGKTAALTTLSTTHKWPRINVNLCLSEKLLELTHRQRAVRVAGILEDAVRDQKADVVLLDNIELLFASELAQDPLKLLQSLSRNRTVVAAWPGNFDGAFLTYAEPGHPEARRYPTPQAVIVRAGEVDQPDTGSPGKETK